MLRTNLQTHFSDPRNFWRSRPMRLSLEKEYKPRMNAREHSAAEPQPPSIFGPLPTLGSWERKKKCGHESL